MASKSIAELEVAAKRLKNAASTEYSDVLRLLYKIGAELRLTLAYSEQDRIFQVQGRCQQVDDLLAAFDPNKPAAQ